ncbi:hypothetical protein D018_3945B, partial [Vibrio parahaemolyticus VP2007-007]
SSHGTPNNHATGANT